MKHKPKVPAAAKRAATVRKPPERTPSALEPVTAQAEVRISKAKGRPMLTWVGKRPLERVTAFPAQLVESFNPAAEKDDSQNLLFHGDNKEVLAYLLANGFRGKVDLVYIDPPFDSGADYVRKVQLRGVSGTAKVEGETYTLGEQIQYTDIWANDNYLQFMYERLLLIKELLSDCGVIFLHTNHEKTHLLRCLLDEVFGPENFRNDIVWKRGPGKSHPKYFGRVKDTILFYCKDPEFTWNKQFKAISEAYRKTFKKKDERGYYVTQPLHSGKPAKNVPEWKGVRPPGGRGWAYKIETLDEFDADDLVEWSEDGVPRLKRYLDEVKGAAIQDVWENVVDSASPAFLQAFFNYLDELSPPEDFDLWNDIGPVLDRSSDHTGYPTQKPTELAERMIRACTKPGNLVMDCFIGSGPTAIAAQMLGRRWIGCDINKGAIQISSKRLQTTIQEQINPSKRDSEATPTLPGIELAKDEESPKPASLAFSVYRVNDYDLQIQHNEAVNLACEHIGVERTRADAFFDGTLGKRLVKITPFNHPLSPLDLEEIKKELKSRPEEDRDIVVVALGKEHAIDVWLEDWNRLRKQGRVPNRIDVIELRTDEKYGKFFVHKPAKAEVKFARQKDKIVVEIQDFLSPTIIERLTAQEGVLKPQITDWRSMVDSVMIDTAYDGKVFNIVLSDVPEKKSDLVQGRYELPAPKGPTTVAVKVTDMLGEEVLVLNEV
jgi:adenine-specific DNA-methyltransferase